MPTNSQILRRQEAHGSNDAPSHSYLLLQHTDCSLWRIPGNDLSVVKHQEFLRRVAARVKQDGLFASRVVREEVSYIENFAFNL